jgi:hypothetical protein
MASRRTSWFWSPVFWYVLPPSFERYTPPTFWAASATLTMPRTGRETAIE